MKHRNQVALVVFVAVLFGGPGGWTLGADMETTPQGVVKALTGLDTWILVQPKAVTPLSGESFDLSVCQGFVTTGAPRELAHQAADRLAAASGVRLPLLDASPTAPVVSLVLSAEPGAFPPALKVDAATFEQLGEQGYALTVEKTGVTLAARTVPGLRHGLTTLAQIAADRTTLPGLVIHDWPSLRYRGAQQDISRGQVPKPETLKRLADVLAEGKMNELELYIEHVYKYKAFPDISPPEGLAPEESKDLALYAARQGVEVHPLLQVLGHSHFILSKPQYQHLRIGPSEKMPWIMTFDIRKPEAVQMVSTMIDELCESFPGELFNVDITEVDIDGLQAAGLTLDQITDLVFRYVLQLNDTVKKHGRRLMITQGPLDSQGHLSGMGPKLDQLPKDIVVGSYYCAGGPYQPAYEKDFARLRDKNIDFFAQAWIYSHVWITPWVNRSAEFSDLEVSRGLKYGAVGSITCDWGDAGHFHFVGEQWLPFLYHGACAWTGAQLDRDYFRQAYGRCLYGLSGDAVTQAIEAASDVNAKTIRVRDKDGKEVDVGTSFIWEFFHDPFSHPEITRIVDPASVGQMLIDAATPALETLAAEAPKAKRNQDNLEQYAFGIRCYLALGHKLLALGHSKDETVPRTQAAEELEAVASEFEALQADFQRLRLAEDRDNSGYQDLVKRFLNTITPCRQQSHALQEGKDDRRKGDNPKKGASDVKEFAEKNIHWLGHDTFKLVGQKTVYIDPFKIQTPDKADIICVTHAHFDHCVPEDIAKLQGDNTVVVAPEDCAEKISGKVQVIKPGQKLTVDGVEIEAVPAYNTNKKFHPKANGWVGYVITLDNVRIYHAGDTDYIPEMKNVRANVALLPVSGTYVMTAEEAVKAALDIRPDVAIPMHYGSIVGEANDAERFQDLLKGKVEVIVKNRE